MGARAAKVPELLGRKASAARRRLALVPFLGGGGQRLRDLGSEVCNLGLKRRGLTKELHGENARRHL